MCRRTETPILYLHIFDYCAGVGNCNSLSAQILLLRRRMETPILYLHNLIVVQAYRNSNILFAQIRMLFMRTETPILHLHKVYCGAGVRKLQGCPDHVW